MLEQFLENEFRELAEEYNPKAVLKKVVLEFTNQKFFNDFNKTVNTDRRGEVGFLLKRKNGKYVLVRSKKYPKNVYRIPTGGIRFNENAIDALHREIKEELGVLFQIECFVGIIEYEIRYQSKLIKFYSFLFEVSEVSGNLIQDATEDEIADYKELPYEKLSAMAHKLQHIESGWRDWCSFRAELLIFYIENHNLRGQCIE